MFKQMGSSIGDGVDKILIVGAVGYGAYLLIKYSGKAVIASSGGGAVVDAKTAAPVPTQTPAKE